MSSFIIYTPQQRVIKSRRMGKHCSRSRQP